MNIAKEIAALRRMTPKELRARHTELFSEPTRSRNKPQLIKKLAWRLQSQAEGLDLSERARRRAEQLSRDSDIRLTAPKSLPLSAIGRTVSGTVTRTDDRLPPPGTVLTREYKGDSLRVTVIEKGFEHEGEVFRSLSALARHITGSHLSGVRFFGLNRK